MSIDWSVMDSYYSRIAHLYDATRPLPKYVSEQLGDRILQIVEATPETKFLEPGIGTGRTGFPIIQRGYSYTGIDISQEMMNELRGKFSPIPDNLTLIQGDAANLPFNDSSFDVVLTTHMLHCLSDPLKGLSEIQRVLKSNGIYLACENLLSAQQKEIWEAFTEIVNQYPSRSKSQREDKFIPFGEELQQELKDREATVEKITAVRWQQSQSVGELFSAYQSRAFGLCWLVSEADFNKAIQEFKAWCLQCYKSFDAILVNDFSFEIIVAKNWA
ncbi:MAG: class I SAM-dependent methyltransferase [Xenococcaceae cyanobacterium MO_188.B32]|nr:class I SAM-dependent methyltransferase [Xenococcaceae cyanobacterium MO_188.B32]